MDSGLRVALTLMCSALMLIPFSSRTGSAAEDHFLDYSEDNFKVAFMSDNLTAVVTHDYPRVLFHHSTDPFSPIFEVGFPRMYLFNDSDLDGDFQMSEVDYVTYLDENHITWNVTPLEFRNETVAGEYAHFRMNATLNLYQGMDNESVAIPDWANITFWFRISERNVTCTNSKGSYVIKGRTDLSMNFTLNILKATNLTGIAIEQLLQGGGSASMFILKQKGSHTEVVDRMVSSRFDERVYGDNFTNDFLATSLAEQDISYAKEDGTVKAYYRWDSVPMMDSGESQWSPPVNCSFITTGTGMVLYSAYALSNLTGSLFQESSIGIDESAFTAKITDWLKENAAAIVLFIAAVAAIVVLIVVLLRARRHLKEKSDSEKSESEKKTGEA